MKAVPVRILMSVRLKTSAEKMLFAPMKMVAIAALVEKATTEMASFAKILMNARLKATRPYRAVRIPNALIAMVAMTVCVQAALVIKAQRLSLLLMTQLYAKPIAS